jgi:ribosomal protein L32
MDATTRRQLLSDLGTGRIKVLTSCALIGEGVDVPSVGGCILLRPTASVGLHLQMIGRCLRPSGSKVAVVLDHVGNCLRLGHHLEPREWTLEGLKKQDREKAPSVKVCPKCYAAMASQSRVCGECGHTFAAEVRELEQVDGELVEVATNGISIGAMIALVPTAACLATGQKTGPYVVQLIDAARKIVLLSDTKNNPSSEFAAHIEDVRPWQKIEAKRQQGTAQSLDDLRQLAQQRGYRRGWAERVYQARLLKRHGG